MLILKESNGAIVDKKEEALYGIIVSFNNNFKPSAMGCKKPKKPTVFGPLRLWKDAIILRSDKVGKATESIKGTMVLIIDKNKRKNNMFLGFIY